MQVGLVTSIIARTSLFPEIYTPILVQLPKFYRTVRTYFHKVKQVRFKEKFVHRSTLRIICVYWLLGERRVREPGVNSIWFIYRHVTLLSALIATRYVVDNIDQTDLCKRQRFRSGTASSANTLLDQRHGELLMRHTVSRATHILGFPAGDVQMYTQKNVFL